MQKHKFNYAVRKSSAFKEQLIFIPNYVALRLCENPGCLKVTFISRQLFVLANWTPARCAQNMAEP